MYNLIAAADKVLIPRANTYIGLIKFQTHSKWFTYINLFNAHKDINKALILDTFYRWENKPKIPQFESQDSNPINLIWGLALNFYTVMLDIKESVSRIRLNSTSKPNSAT